MLQSFLYAGIREMLGSALFAEYDVAEEASVALAIVTDLLSARACHDSKLAVV